MADPNMTLALRIQADLRQAEQALGALDRQLEQAGQQAQQAGAQLNTTAAAVDRLGSESAAAAASVQRVGSGAAAASAGLAQQAAAMQRAGLTAGQYQQAMRMLPMQMTDVVTSIASGMPIWMVAIQQGGQIRDSFGGIGNAARAVVSSINPMAAAIGAAAVVGGTLLAAFQQGQREMTAYAQALILTGNAAGTTADQLATMAERMGEGQGTQRQAAAALAEIAASGKIAGDQMEMVGTAAIAMERSTGRAVSDTVEEFAKLADEPSKASAELNKQYNYLTASVYRQIRALEEQGDKVGAARLAIETYGQVAVDRSAQVEQQLGYLEQAWRAVGEGAKNAWDRMLDIGRPATLQQQLQEAEASLERLQSRRLRNGTVDTRGIQAAEERVEALQQEIDDAADEAANQQLSGRLNQEAIASRQAGEHYLQGLKEEAEQLRDLGETEKALEFIQKKRIGTESDLGRQILAQAKAYEDLEASNEAAEEAERAAERATREREQAAKRAEQDAERQRQQQERYVQSLERQAAVLGMTAAEVRRYDLDQQDLTGTLRQSAAAQLATIEAYEKQRQAIENASTNAGMEAEYLRAIGRDTDAALLEMRAKFDALRADFEKTGNDAGKAWIDKLIPVAEAKINLDEIQRQIGKIQEERSRQEQSVDVQQDSGLLTELDARERILDIHRQTYDKLQQIRPLLVEMAQKPGEVGEAARAALSALDTETARLQTTTSLLESTLRDGLATGLSEALSGLASGTMDLRDAITALGMSVVDAMAQMAAKNLAEQATAGIMSLFGGQQSDSGLTAGAAAVSGSAMSLSAAGATLIEGAAAISAAAASLAAANGVKGVTGGGAGGSGGGFLSGIGDWFGGLFGGGSGAGAGSGGSSSWLSWLGFADGGHVSGPGTGTSDSIAAWLSNGEFVTRAAVTQQPGALAFLQAFNARGMDALDDYARRVRHATGGLASVPAPALPAPSLGSTRLAEPAKQFSTNVDNNFRFVNVFDIDDVSTRLGSSRMFEKQILNIITDNQSAIRSTLS